jgi:hypothetical protein
MPKVSNGEPQKRVRDTKWVKDRLAHLDEKEATFKERIKLVQKERAERKAELSGK